MVFFKINRIDLRCGYENHLGILLQTIRELNLIYVSGPLTQSLGMSQHGLRKSLFSDC